MTNINWDEREGELKERWAAGQSAGVIAVEMLGNFRHRNAVIGKVHRLGLNGHGKPTTSNLPPKRPKKTAVSVNAMLLRLQAERERAEQMTEAQQAAELAALPPDESPHAVTMMQLEQHHCRYPLWGETPTDQKYCGAPKQLGSYCHRHAMRCYGPGAGAR